MAKRDLATMFDDFDQTDNDTVTEENQTGGKNEQKNERTQPKGNNGQQKGTDPKGTQTSETTPETAVTEDESNVTTLREVTASLLDMYDQKTKKKTVEQTHIRSTFLFRKDLQERLDKLAEGKRGFKTMFMNKAIEALLDEMEGLK